MERTRNLIAITIVVFALSAAGCGGSPPAAATPAASLAASDSVSSAPSASTPPAAASPSQAASTELTWTHEGALPAGWSEEDGSFSRSENAYVEIMPDRSVMAADCVLGPEAGVGRTSADIVRALAARPGLTTTILAPVQIAGLAGGQFDLRLTTGWKGSCDWWDDPKTPVVPLFGRFDEKNQWLFTAVTKGEQYRYVVLDIPGGRNVVIAITAIAPERFEDMVEPAMDIVQGLRFSVPE